MQTNGYIRQNQVADADKFNLKCCYVCRMMCFKFSFKNPSGISKTIRDVEFCFVNVHLSRPNSVGGTANYSVCRRFGMRGFVAVNCICNV